MRVGAGDRHPHPIIGSFAVPHLGLPSRKGLLVTSRERACSGHESKWEMPTPGGFQCGGGRGAHRGVPVLSRRCAWDWGAGSRKQGNQLLPAPAPASDSSLGTPSGAPGSRNEVLKSLRNCVSTSSSALCFPGGVLSPLSGGGPVATTEARALLPQGKPVEVFAVTPPCSPSSLPLPHSTPVVTSPAHLL